MKKITWQERLGFKLLRRTHWFCVKCGDFHRQDNQEKCSNVHKGE